LAAEVAELAGDVVAQSPRAVAAGEVLYIAWNAYGAPLRVRFFGSNRMCRNPLATLAVIAPLWCVVRSAGAGSPVSAFPRAPADRSAHPWRPVSARPARALRHRQPRRDIAGAGASAWWPPRRGGCPGCPAAPRPRGRDPAGPPALAPATAAGTRAQPP